MSPGVMDDSAKCDRLQLILEEWVGGFCRQRETGNGEYMTEGRVCVSFGVF